MPEYLPDFLIIGAAKAGTTSLFYYLAQHPDICVPGIKEPNFFSSIHPDTKQPVDPGCGPGDTDATEWTVDIDRYQGHFRHCNTTALKGEASVSYLYSPYAPANIQQTLPDAKLIVMLRNPVDRAWSQYLHMIRDGRETLGFEAALAKEEQRIQDGWEFSWHYRSLGFYGRQLERYLQLFSAKQMHIILFENFINDPMNTLSELVRFLNIATDHPFKEETAHNRTGLPISPLFSRIVNRPSTVRNWIKRALPVKFGHHIMEKLRQANLQPEKPQIPKSARLSLLVEYKPDIVKLEKLTGRDLSAWYRDLEI